MDYLRRDISRNLIVIAVSSLLLAGLIMVISTTYIPAGENYGDNYFFIKRQLLFILIGVLVFYSIRFFNISKLESLVPLIVGISIILLALTLVPGIGVKIYGARRWIKFLPFLRFQSSEFAKISIILFLANYYKKHKEDSIRVSFINPLIVVGILVFLVMLEPDYSTSVLLVVLTIGIMLSAGVRLRILFSVILGVIPLGALAIFLSPYRLKRVVAFLDPWKDPTNTGFQIIQSYIAIYLGGFFGVGLGNSKEKLFYLPEAHNDFILAIVTEETGFLGVLVLFILFSMIFYASIRIALRIEDVFKSILAFGIGLLLFLQFTFNVSVVIGLFPVTGVPLPFISYGGTSLVITMFLLGILHELSKEV